MTKVTKPRVRDLALGSDYVAKQMAAKEGDLLPLHSADVESIMFIHEGECILILDGVDHPLKAGEAMIVPPHIKHQFRGITDFRGVHFMPKDIKIEYFD